MDISYFVKSGQLFLKICIYALHTVAVISISTNIPTAIAIHTVYSQHSVRPKVLFLALPHKGRLPQTLLPILRIPDKNS